MDIRDIKVFPKTREEQEAMIKDVIKLCSDPSQWRDPDETIRKARLRNEERILNNKGGF